MVITKQLAKNHTPLCYEVKPQMASCNSKGKGGSLNLKLEGMGVLMIGILMALVFAEGTAKSVKF